MKEEKKEPLPDFSWIRESILAAIACTSLSDEEAQARVPFAGTRFGWQLTDDPRNAPVPCLESPETHRHIVFEC